MRLGALGIDILTRPFAVSPTTGLMSTDGIVVAGAGPANIGAFIVNRTGSVLEDVVVRACIAEKSRMVLTA